MISTMRLLTLLLLLPFALTAAEKKPNVLVIVSDDQGYVDAGFQGGKDVPTPNLDALAESGVRCTSGYVSHPFCSPTRAGLLTGRQQQRFGHEYNPVYDPLDPKEGLPLSERLLPQFMKDGGYRTGWVGKWHLGASPEHVPVARGFDDAYGFVGGGHRFINWKADGRQYTLPLTRGGKEEPIDPTEHLTLRFGKEAARFIGAEAGRPWFLYLAFNAPHTPHEPTPEAEAPFAHVKEPNRRKYLAQVALMDRAIGDVLEALRKSGQDRDTLVFFFSDNGGPVKNGANNGVLNGQKGQVFEGGVRVPFIVSWPAVLPAGASYHRPVSSLDVFATALARAGVTPPDDRKRDGVDLVPFLRGEAKGDPHEFLAWRSSVNLAWGLRQGDWKLVRQRGQPDRIFDLASDVGETRDLSAEKPEVLRQLTSRLEAWNAELIEPVFLGSSAKSEDFGPGGVNQKPGASSKKKKAK